MRGVGQHPEIDRLGEARRLDGGGGGYVQPPARKAGGDLGQVGEIPLRREGVPGLGVHQEHVQALGRHRRRDPHLGGVDVFLVRALALREQQAGIEVDLLLWGKVLRLGKALGQLFGQGRARLDVHQREIQRVLFSRCLPVDGVARDVQQDQRDDDGRFVIGPDVRKALAAVQAAQGGQLLPGAVRQRGHRRSPPVPDRRRGRRRWRG